MLHHMGKHYIIRQYVHVTLQKHKIISSLTIVSIRLDYNSASILSTLFLKDMDTNSSVTKLHVFQKIANVREYFFFILQHVQTTNEKKDTSSVIYAVSLGHIFFIPQ